MQWQHAVKMYLVFDFWVWPSWYGAALGTQRAGVQVPPPRLRVVAQLVSGAILIRLRLMVQAHPARLNTQ